MKMKMLIALAVLVLGVVMAAADTAPACGLLQRVKVNRQWRTAYGEGDHRIDFVTDVFEKYFRAYPKARDVLKSHRSDNIYSVEFQAHAHRILGGIGLVINTADEPETAKLILGKVKEDLTEKNVAPEYLEAFVHELVETLPHHIENSRFDRDAWSACLDLIFNAVKT